jgi:hypothetical protein
VHHLLAGDLRSAAEHARSSFDRSMAMGVEPPQYLGKLGLIEMLLGSLAAAGDHFERTLASRNHRAGYSRAITLLNLAEVRTLQGRPAQASSCSARRSSCWRTRATRTSPRSPGRTWPSSGTPSAGARKAGT